MKTEPIRFDGQVVIVTGAGRGLGAAYAKLLAARGASVVVHDAGVNRDGTGGDTAPALAVAAEIEAAGGTTVAATSNLAQKEACEALVETAVSQFGRLDVLIHSAGLVAYEGIETTSDSEWEHMLDINIQAPFWLCRAAWPLMREQKYGRIVLTVSGYGLQAFDGSDVTAYGIGKAAQFGLMNGLAGEGSAHDILVNAISPVAATRIYRSNIGREALPPESVATAVALLASRQCPWNGKVLQAAGGRFALAEFDTIKEVTLEIVPEPEALLAALR
ncbi:MAG: SDR family NAD(P)-dependent oxidoreductase [Chloroflexota bacterium]